MKKLFFGGIHPKYNKEMSTHITDFRTICPETVVIPMQQHIGAPCKPLVKKGDVVTVGQKIGDNQGLCVPVHSPVSGKVKLVVQTPSVRMHETLLAIKKISKATLRAMDRIRFNAPRPFDVTYAFYKELESTPALVTYPIPMLILHGEYDSVIRQEDIQNFARINEQSKLVIIPGASHRFAEPGAWDMVLDLTRDWFEYEQVLLSDWS